MQPKGNFQSGSCEITPSMSQDFIAPWELHCQVGLCHSGILGFPFHSKKVTNITKKFTGGKNGDYSEGEIQIGQKHFSFTSGQKIPATFPPPSLHMQLLSNTSFPHTPSDTVFSLLRRKLWTDHVTSPLLQSPPLLLPKTNSMVASRWQAGWELLTWASLFEKIRCHLWRI